MYGFWTTVWSWSLVPIIKPVLWTRISTANPQNNTMQTCTYNSNGGESVEPCAMGSGPRPQGGRQSDDDNVTTERDHAQAYNMMCDEFKQRAQ